jgi:3-deoxy-7-phosphoheptulonate synthase
VQSFLTIVRWCVSPLGSSSPAARGKTLIDQRGFCLASLGEQDPIEHKLSLILLMSLIVIWGGRLPVVRIMRIAGQFAKPRSSSHEVVEGFGKVLSFRCVSPS